MQPERPLPVAGTETIEVEQVLLGTLLVHPDKIDTIREVQTEDDFIEPLHRTIWRTMLERHDAGERITIANLTARIGPVEMGGISLREYLARMAAQMGSSSHSLVGTSRAVRDAAGMRLLQDISADLLRDLSTGGIIDPVPVAVEMIRKADEIVATHLVDTARPMTLGQAARKAVEAALLARECGTPPGTMLGLPEVDRMTNGVHPGQLVILAGRPGMGKTATAITFSLNAARKGVSALMISLEMTAQDLAERALSEQCYRQGHDLEYQKVAEGVRLSDLDVQHLDRAETDLAKLPMRIEQRPGMTLAQIASAARRYFATQREAGYPEGLLVVDYLGLVQASGRYRGQRVNETGETTRGLKALAKELGVPIILLCQLNRAVESRDDKKPRLPDLRDSGDIEQDADTVIFCYREEYYLAQLDTNQMSSDELMAHMEAITHSRNVMEIGVAKQRKGPTGWVRNFCNIGCNAITGLSTQ